MYVYEIPGPPSVSLPLDFVVRGLSVTRRGRIAADSYSLGTGELDG